jgi:hypothetical protein
MKESSDASDRSDGTQRALDDLRAGPAPAAVLGS